MHSTLALKASKPLRHAVPIACLLVGIPLGLMQLSFAGTAASPVWGSAMSIAGIGPNTGEAIKVDRHGNRYVTGAFSATALFPTRALVDIEGGAQSAAAHVALTSRGSTDVFLAKYDSSGNLRWVLQAGGSEDDYAFDLAFDAGDNIYITGYFTDSATFQGRDNTDASVTGDGQTIFLAKYTSAGQLAWVQTGTASHTTTEGYGVAIEPVTGSVYLTGIGQGGTTFSSSNGTMHTIAGPGTWHMVLAKFDTAGNFHWAQTNEASPNSLGRKVAVDADNNAYVTGWMEGSTTFYSNDGHDVTVVGFSGPVQSPPDYPDDAFVVQYNEDGNVEWVNHIGGYKAIGTDIAVSRDGRVSITGFIGNIASSTAQAETIVTSQAGGNNINLGGGQLTSPYNKDAFFATYDDAGVLLDARRFGGPEDEGGSGIAYDRHSNLILAGVFQNAITIEGQTLSQPGSFNLFIAKFARGELSCSPGAMVDWVKAARGPFIVGDFEYGSRIGLTAQADVVVTGAYQPGAQFGNFVLNSGGSQDGFLAFLKTPEDEHQRQ